MIDDQTRVFIAGLHRGGGWGYYWIGQTQGSIWWPVGKMANIPTDEMSVYFGVHPTAQRKGASERSTNADISVINCLFADFDAKDYDGSKEAALAHIRQLPIAPSVTIDSGGGYHCYWLLAEPFFLSTAELRDRARRVQAGWVKCVGGDPAAKDLARVLRVPGTRNHKPQYGPDFPLVSFVEMDLTRTYDLAGLEQLVPAPPVCQPVTDAQPLTEPRGDGSRYAQVALEDELRILARTTQGSRNHQLNSSAFALGQFVGGGYLDQRVVEDELHRTACQIGLDTDSNCGESGIWKTIRSGMEDGRHSPRIIPDRPIARPGERVGSLPPLSAEAEPAPVPVATAESLIAQLEVLRSEEGKAGRRQAEQAALGMVDALALLPEVDRLNVLSCLSSLDVTQKFIADLKGAIKKRQSQVRSTSGAMPEHVRPWPYKARDGQMFHLQAVHGEDGGVVDVKEDLIAGFQARIEAEVVEEGGEVAFTVTGLTAYGKQFNVDITTQAFADDRQLLAHLTTAAGATAAVMVGMQRHLRPAIQLLSEVDMPRMRKFTRTGWLPDGTFLIPGREPQGVVIALPRKLPYRIPAEADLAAGLRGLTLLVNAMPAKRSSVALAALFEAPLARLAGWQDERYALFIAGRSGSLKTTWTQTALALYGPGFVNDGQLIKWGEGATRNAIMSMATYANDMPFLIDNYKPNTGGGSNDYTNLIHNIIEGGEKDRLNRNAQLKETKPVFCWPVFTGEDVPDSDPASLARTLIVPFEWTKGEANEPLTEARGLSQHLSAVGWSWIAWLVSNAGQQAARAAAKLFETTRAEWARKLRAERKDMVNSLRVASNLATNQLTWWVMQQHPEIGPVIQEFTADHAAGLGETAEQMAGRTAESFEAVRFLSALRELLATGRCVLLSKDTPASNLEPHPERMLGWRDGTDESTYILPTIAYQMVEKFLGPGGLSGVSAKTLYAQLASLGHFASQAPGRNTVLLHTIMGTHRVLHLNADALSAVGDGEGDAGAPDVLA